MSSWHIAAAIAQSLDYGQQVVLLIVAGGGGGGGSTAGGGGGGGVISTTLTVPLNSPIPIAVGLGGSGSVPANAGLPSNTSGGDSVFGNLTAIGGGYGFSGAVSWSRVAASGGSGGGSANYSANNIQNAPAGAGTSGQGFAGYSPTGEAGGGGGGAGGPATGVSGGPGATSSITGSAVTYARGGDGYTEADVRVDQPANTGNGSAGGFLYGSSLPPSGSGGSGIVIIRLPATKTATFANATFTSAAVGADTVYSVTGTSAGATVTIS